MNVRMEFLVNIQDTEPNRSMGSLKDLRESISEVGLINPLTIDTDGRLLAGRRRYKAMVDLGWEECLVRVLDPKDELECKMISLYENLRRKPLTDPENRRMIAEIDVLMRAKFGSKPEHRPKKSSESDDLWTTDKTADKLGISTGSVREAKTARAHVEDHPELAGERTPVVLDHKKREDILDGLSEKDADYLRPKAEQMDFSELKEKVSRSEEIATDIENLPDSDFKQKLEADYTNVYAKYDTNPDIVRREIRKHRGRDIAQMRTGLDLLDKALIGWQEKHPEFDNILDVEGWCAQIKEVRSTFTSLSRVDYPIIKFATREGAELFGNSRGGYCGGSGTIAGVDVWIIYEKTGGEKVI